METFSYLSVLLSIVLGLAITQVLLGFRGLILSRTKVKLYSPTLIWAVLALLISIQVWWANFDLRSRAHWAFAAFFVIVLQAISVYMASALILPDVTGDASVDLRDHYYAHRRWFFGALTGAIIFSASKEVALSGRLPGGVNGIFHVSFGAAAIAAAITGREWFHQLMTPIMGLLFVLYIAVLFAKL